MCVGGRCAHILLRTSSGSHPSLAAQIQFGDWLFSLDVVVRLWSIKEHRGLAVLASLTVGFDAAASSLGDPPGSMNCCLREGL